MKKLLPILLLVGLLIGVSPMQAFAYPTWIDPDGQISPNPWEHYVFYKGYYYAMYQNNGSINKQIRWNADPVIWSYTYNAMQTWSILSPPGIEAMTEEPLPNNADLTVSYSSCPNHPDYAGCFTISSWYLAAGLNARLWKKAGIYIRYGYDWTTNSVTGALRHEIGHALGFGDQYGGMGFCNSGYYGLMDTLWHNNQGYWQNCDTEGPTGMELQKWSDFHITGWYTFVGQGANSAGKLTVSWEDNAWNDHTMHNIYKQSSGQNGTYTTFAESYHSANNGSHNDVTWPYAYWLTDEMYPYLLGVNNKWVKVCKEPLFNWLGNVGTQNCSPAYYYHYP